MRQLPTAKIEAVIRLPAVTQVGLLLRLPTVTIEGENDLLWWGIGNMAIGTTFIVR